MAEEQKNTQTIEQNISNLLNKYDITLEGNTLKSDWGLPTISADENIKKNILDVDYYWNFAGTTNPKIDVEFLITDKNKTKKWININKNDNVENTNINNYIVSASINDNGFKELNLVLYDRNFTDIQRIISNSIETFNHKSTAVDETNSTAIDEDNEITYSIDKDQVSSNIRIRYGYNDDKDTTINKESKYIGVGTWKEDQDTKYRWRTVESEYEIEDGIKLKKEEKNDLSTDNTLKNHMQQATLFSNWEEFIIIGLTTNLTNSGVKYNIKAISSANAKLNGYKMYQSYSSLRGKPKMLLASLMKMFNEQDEDHFSPIRIVWNDPNINAEEAPLNGQELIYDYEEATYKALGEKEANDIKEKITKPIEDLTSYTLMLADIRACFKTNTENTLSSYVNNNSVGYEKNISSIDNGKYTEPLTEKTDSFLGISLLPYSTNPEAKMSEKPDDIVASARYQASISNNYDVISETLKDQKKVNVYTRDVLKIWLSNIAIKAYGVENYSENSLLKYKEAIKKVEEIEKKVEKLDIKYQVHNISSGSYFSPNYSENASKYIKANGRLRVCFYIFSNSTNGSLLDNIDNWKELNVPSTYKPIILSDRLTVGTYYHKLTWQDIKNNPTTLCNFDKAINILGIGDRYNKLKKFFHDKEIQIYLEKQKERFINEIITQIDDNSLKFNFESIFSKIGAWPSQSYINDLQEEKTSLWNKRGMLLSIQNFINDLKDGNGNVYNVVMKDFLSYYNSEGKKIKIEENMLSFEKIKSLTISSIDENGNHYGKDTPKIKIIVGNDNSYFLWKRNTENELWEGHYITILETLANFLSMCTFANNPYDIKEIKKYKAKEKKKGEELIGFELEETDSIVFLNDKNDLDTKTDLLDDYKSVLDEIYKVREEYFSEGIEELLEEYSKYEANIKELKKDFSKTKSITAILETSMKNINNPNNPALQQTPSLKEFVINEKQETKNIGPFLNKAWEIAQVMQKNASDEEGINKDLKNLLNNIDSELEIRSKELERLTGLSDKVNNTNIGKEIELSLGSQESRNKDLKLKLTKNISSILNDYCSQCGQLISNIEEAYANQKGREVTTENGTEIVGVHKDFPRYSLTWDVIKEIEYKGHTVPIIGLHYKKPIKPKKIRKYKWGNGNNRPHCIKNISISNSSEFALMHNISTVTETNGANKTNNTNGEIVIEAENKKYSEAPSFFNMAFNTERDERVFKDMLNSINKGTITLLGDPSLRFEGDIQPYTYPIRLDIALGKETRSWSNSDGIIEDSQLSGYYVISNITHEISNAGYTTTLEIVKYPIEKNTYIGYTSPPLPDK